MSTGPMSHPGNNPPRPDPCPACQGNGYVIEMWDRPGGPPGNQVMACERCNPPRRALGSDIPRTRQEIWGSEIPVRSVPTLPVLYVKCHLCDGWGLIDKADGKFWICPDCEGLGRIPTAAGRAILEFLEFEWPKQENMP